MPDVPLSRKRAQTQLKLMKAATEVFSERGIMASTVEQICERAGYTRGAFYSNFESKESLCIELLHAEKLFYQKAFAKGVAATFAHFAANPQDKLRAPYELIEISLELVLPHIFLIVDAEDEMWSTASLLYSELGLYAVREPSVRQAYVDYVQSWTAPFALLLEQVLPLCGLRFRVSVQESVQVLSAVFEKSSRDAQIAFPRDPETGDADTAGRIALVKSDLLMVARMMSEPAQGIPVEPAAPKAAGPADPSAADPSVAASPANAASTLG